MRATSFFATVSLTGMLFGCGGGGSGSGSSSGAPATANSTSIPSTDISGVVVDKNGAPIADALVTAWRTNDHTDRTATTDASGHYSFTGLNGTFPYGNYELRVEKSSFGFYPTASSSPAAIIKQDYNAQYRMVVAVPTHGSHTVTDANFIGLQAGDSRISIARTGQTASVANGDDVSANRGIAWPSVRFTDNNDGTVTDALTGLVWLKDAGCFTDMNWTAALAAANQLANGSCGLSDSSTAGQWRLPNVAELESLVDISQSSPALSAGHPFTNVGTYYWTSTTYRGVPFDAWVIRFSDGRYINDSAGNVKTTSMNGLWAVKSGSSAGTISLPATGQFIVYGTGDDGDKQVGVRLTSPRFIDNGDGTVADTVTGLIWLKRADCIHDTWDAALSTINSLASGQCGLTDGSAAGQWRMPNRNELLSLMDRAETNEALLFNTTFYNSDGSVNQAIIFRSYIENEFYWTSSSLAFDTTQAWTVYSCDWGVYNALKSAIGYSLAVR